MFINFQVGNVYVYHYSQSFLFGGFSGKVKLKINKDTIVNGKQYFYLDNFPGKYRNKWVRQNPVTYSLYYFDTLPNCNNHIKESLLDSFLVQDGDYIVACLDTLIRCDSIRIKNLFLRNTKYYYAGRSFSNSVSSSNSNNTLCEYFGIYNVFSSGGGGGGFSSSNHTLRGCIINGVIFGDTTTNIQLISQYVNDYKLNQNYPNPFNPETNISFSIKDKSKIKLSIFDNIGREVSILVNSVLPQGSYIYSFRGENLPSGVYYYKLESEKFSEIKKMVLIK